MNEEELTLQDLIDLLVKRHDMERQMRMHLSSSFFR